MNKINIDGHVIGENESVFIIAEIGVNHNGNLDTAKKLIDSAKNAGADCVKFQTFITNEVISLNTPLAEYQKKSSTVSSQNELVQKLELNESSFKQLNRSL